MKVNSFTIMLFMVLSFLVLAACAPRPTPSQEKLPAAPASPLTQFPAKEAWEEKWQSLVKAARKEGKVFIYSAGGAEIRALAQAFKKRYGIDVETVSGRTPELASKISSERRAGLYIVDVLVSGGGSLTRMNLSDILNPLEPELLLPELTDPGQIGKLWFEGKVDFIDRATRSILTFAAFVIVPFSINTDLVKRDEIKSYKDLLQPKWKGKISLNNPTMPGAGGSWFSMALWGKIVDLDYMRSLARQEPVILTDTRLQVDWLAKGRYPVAIATQTPVMTEYVMAGAPVQRLPAPIEGAYLGSGVGSISLIKDRPHPNAARLYLNWLLSQEGQAIYSVNSGRQSRRLDVPADHINPDQRRQSGVKYVSSDEEEFIREQDHYYQLAREVFGPYMR